MKKYIFFVFFTFIFAAQTSFAFEISNSVIAKDSFVPFSRYLEKLDNKGWTVISGMTDEQKNEANEEIDKMLASAKGDFEAEFEPNDEAIKITVYDGFSPVVFNVLNPFIKRYEIPDCQSIDYEWLDKKLTQAGAQRYRTTGSDAVYFLKTAYNKQCFIIAENKENSTISFLSSNVIPNDCTLTLKREDFDGKDQGLFFTQDSVSGKSQIAKVAIKAEEGAKIFIRYYNETSYEKHYETYEKEVILETIKSKEFVLDDIPAVDGFLNYNVRVEGEVESITMKFLTGSDLPVVNYGSTFGTLVLKGVDSNLGAELIPYFRSSEGEKIFTNPILDDAGNFIFTVPAGYYKLLFAKNPYMDSVEGRCFAQNIPVSAGEATEIIIPTENARAINELRKQYVIADENKDTGSIQLTNLSVKDTKGAIELIVNDPLERDVFPEQKEVKVLENGVEGKVTKIEREPQPVDVVLVLDSSGSMGENMKPAVEAAKSFVNSLPDSSNIRFIQFAQKITEHKGEKKAEIIKALDTVKSIGATAMYDALDKALKLLENKKKPYIVLFSDGADSREPGVDGKGSDLTKEQIISKLGKSKVTLLAIGFGKGHDPKTLKAMSEVTPNGMYVAAADKKALPAAFAAVSSKFGNQFKISYDRPYTSIDSKSDVPVIAMMIDNSRSMDMAPEEAPDDDVGYRMDKLKTVFHDFILGLPSNSLMSLMTFTGQGMEPSYIDSKQILTDNKASVLRALSECQGYSGTPINDALTVAINNLKSLSSSKRVLIFFTDAALDWESKESEALRIRYEELLKELKKENIRVLFAGLGGADYVEKYKAPFVEAAKISGGDYIITANTKDIANKLNELLKKVDEPLSTKKNLTLSVAIDAKTEDGSRMNYSAVNSYDKLTPLEKKGQIVKPGVISIKTGQKYAFKPQVKAEGLVSHSETAKDTEVFNRVKFQNKPTANNKFASIEAQELYLLNKFKGFEPTKGIFAALKVKISFKKANKNDKEIGYEIPSIFNHFYLSLNNCSLTAPSKLTWLAENTITKIPEKVSIFVDEKNTAEGFFVFDMPYEYTQNGMTQISLHYFDETHGHIELPMVGRMSEKLESIKSLPNTEPQKITDAFSLKVKGFEDKDKAGQAVFDPYANSAFRIIDADFISKVSALLDIKPIERFYYAIETDNGPLMVKMNNAVYSMPLGFVSKLMFAPGSNNPVRLPFVIGKELTNNSSYIWGDVAKCDVKIKLTDGKPWSGKKLGKKYSHEHFDLIINDIGRINENQYAIVDFTIVDKPDEEGLGTGGLTTLFTLDCKAEKPEELEDAGNGGTIIKAITRRGLADFGSVGPVMPGRVNPDVEYMRSLAYGIDENWGAFEGTSRRGIVAFKLTDQYKDSDEWELISDFIPSLKLKLPKEEFTNKALLAQNYEIAFDDSLDRRIDEAVAQAKLEYEATHKEVDKTPKIGLNKEDKPLTTVSVPAITLYGTEKINSVKSEKDIIALFEKLKIAYNQRINVNVFYSPEAVITQGWGNDSELTNLAEKLLIKLGNTPSKRYVELTQKGEEKLKSRTLGNIPEKTLLTALEYKSDGKPVLFVPAFGKNLSDLNGLCYFKNPVVNETYYEKSKITLKVSVYGKLTGDAGIAAQQAIAADMFGALGGSEGTETDDGIFETTSLFNKEFTVNDFSSDLFDVSFQSVGKSSDGKGDIVCAVIDSPNGVIVDEKLWIDTSCYEIKSVTIQFDEHNKTTRLLGEGKKLTDLHFTLGYFMPTLTEPAVKAYEEAIKVRAEGIKDASNYTKVKWQGHAALAKFIRAFGKISDNLSKKFDIIVPRVAEEDALAVAAICESDGKNATIGIDLINVAVSSAIEQEGQSEKAKYYNTVAGLLASQIEASVLPGGKGESYAHVWATMPKNAGLITIGEEGREEICNYLVEKNFPKLLTERLKDEKCNNLSFIVPTAQGIRNGKPAWAWLEVNNDTGYVVSMFDNGERSGLAGYVIGLNPYNECNFVAGAMIGLTCSNFAVAAYTLEFDNEKAVMASAKKLCQALCEVIGAIEGLASSKDLQGYFSGALGSIAGDTTKNLVGVDFNEVYKHIKIIRGDDTYVPTFSEGFKTAIFLYFGK